MLPAGAGVGVKDYAAALREAKVDESQAQGEGL